MPVRIWYYSNVRRCLPGDALVYTKDGLIPIRDIEVGTEVLTASGYEKVSNKFTQGEQELVRIVTQDGDFKCTANHRMAVCTGYDKHTWKEAGKLSAGDRLMTSRSIVCGTKTKLPGWKYTKKSSSCKDITPPTLDTDMAWLLGLFQGNGYTYPNYKKNGFNAYVSIVGGLREYDVAFKAQEQLRRFGDLHVPLKKRKNENSWIVHCQSKQLAWYLDQNLKQANTTLRIPSYIMNGSPEIRLAFVAGVCDADGCLTNRPIQVLTTVYEEFARDIQQLLYSCGIESRFTKGATDCPSRWGWQQLFSVNLITKRSQILFAEIPELHRKMRQTTKSQYANGFPTSFETVPKVKTKYGLYSNKQFNIDAYEREYGECDYTPVEVVRIEPANSAQTYDIEVENEHEFFCNGYRTHNSAEICLGDVDDKDFLNLKNYKINPERSEIGWMSNNSVVLQAAKDYKDFTYIPDMATRIRDNGEPGMINLYNIQKFGRYGKVLPDQATLVNPCGEICLEDKELCVSGDTRILTREGYPRISDCVNKSVEIWNGDKWSTVTPFPTGTDKVLYRVTLTDGSYLDATEKHKWSARPTKGSKLREIKTCDLKVGMRLEMTELDAKDFRKTGLPLKNAYTWGFFTGDGYVDNKYLMVVLFGTKKSLYDEYIPGKKYKEQQRDFDSNSFFRVNVTDALDKRILTGTKLRDSSAGLPDIFFTMDTESIFSFLAGWIDADGTVRRYPLSENYVIDSVSRQKLLDLQLLLRRVGINFSSVNIVAHAGQELVINKRTVTRKQDLWRIYIPSFECSKIAPHCKLKILERFGQRFKMNPRYPKGAFIDFARKQKVKSIERLDGLHDTFCFTEPLAHKGMFNNVLTHQCNLSETFPPRCQNADRFFEALKFATFYASTVSLLPTHRPETNAVIARNRRIGVSISGVAQWASGEVPKDWGPMNYTKMTRYLRAAHRLVRAENQRLAKEAGVPESIRVTTVKPSGSISLLAGVTPGVHYPVSRYAIRRMRIGKDSPLVPALVEAKIPHEDDTYSDNTLVFEFAIDHGNVRPCEEVSPWEQFSLVAMMQRCYADNCVSATIYFDKDKDGPDVEKMLAMFIPTLKSVSMLPHSGHGYAQAPYEPIDKETYEKRKAAYNKPNFGKVKDNIPIGSKFCTGDKCML